MQEVPTIAPGAHLLVRDAVWRVVQINHASNGKAAWHVLGVSEIVRDQEAIFLEEYEPTCRVLDPRETALVLDHSSGHRASLLYMESLLRDVPPTSPELHIGHRGAMDVLEYQLEPARKALQKPRQRILIADAVGLGKTLEAGILLSELIRRGRGRRILVATVKSMLTQFQKELWCRFAIPLVRLDSVGLQKIRERIPTHHNPFYHYDKTIISIDTLKQNNAFRTHVEGAWWDIIVIDEAHNVAARGGGRSQRARIAEILAERSDALILLSATPHDGKARSFASLMNMLDPTAITNPDEYTPKEIEGLFIRRFKKDIQSQVGKAFPTRIIAEAHAIASPAEEVAFKALTALDFSRIDQQNHAGMLFKTTLEKALFSSPAACLQTLKARIKRLEERDDHSEFASDVAQLRPLETALLAIDETSFSKYQKLLHTLRDAEHGLNWSPRNREDRLVIFSERIETLTFLKKHLTRDLKLKEDQVAVLTGELPDTEQQALVENFGKSASPLRLLLASDVASEGLNLHYLCHKLIHFDVPWSLMVFQQRNGRIDRYGQERTPTILYLLTDAQTNAIRGDIRILELLIQRDEQATKNIGDPSALMGVYDIDAEERMVARAIEQGLSIEAFDAQLGGGTTIDPLEIILGLASAPASAATQSAPEPKDPLTLFKDDFAYLDSALEHLAETQGIERTVRRSEKVLELMMPRDLRRRFDRLPDEVLPADGKVVLTPDRKVMQQAMADARLEETAWPQLQYLWPLNPVVQWVNDKVRALFGRHTAPVMTLLEGLDASEAAVVVSGLIPNRRSQPLVHRWFVARFREGALTGLEDFGEFARQLKLGSRPLHNRQVSANLTTLRALIPPAVEATRKAMVERRTHFETHINAQLNHELSRLEALKVRQLKWLADQYADKPAHAHLYQQEMRRVNRTFDRYLEWVQDSMTTEPAPFLQVIAVLRSEQGFGGAA